MFINLIENSIEAMHGKGDIYIATRLCLSRHAVHIEIRDTGPGTSEQYREKFFEPYFSAKKRGAGIGLSLAQRIIANHKGSITLTTWHSAPGATFLIELPVT